MAASGSRSPSPVNAPPVLATPGPRAAMLTKIYDEAISHTMDSCSYENFSACFPTTTKNVPEALEALHKQFVDRLGDRCRKQFEDILRERNVVSSLNDLDRLVDEARKRRAKAQADAKGNNVGAPLPPHTLPARSLYLAHLHPTLQSRQTELRDQLQSLQSNNGELLKKLTAQRSEINHIVESVEQVVQDIDASLEILSPHEMQALTKATVDLDVEMRPAD
ncbi:Nnf1-domain-containing protein [Elsinoe ampelina]|uniref:Nnf1-domain-containing protein n=1 Tax=Elsinoe ampelina TaxID=302913 RepID=A0A6A6GH31_9PEZI|nr:Nnf1-domain-containing protein [Elsinoe ampelina]